MKPILALLLLFLLQPSRIVAETRVVRSRGDQQVFSRVVRSPVVEDSDFFEENNIKDSSDLPFFRNLRGDYSNDFGHRIWLGQPFRNPYYYYRGNRIDSTDGYKRGSSSGGMSGIRLI